MKKMKGYNHILAEIINKYLARYNALPRDMCIVERALLSKIIKEAINESKKELEECKNELQN